MQEPPAIARTRHGFRIRAHTQVPSGVRMQEDGRLLVGRGTVIEGGVYLAGSLYTEPAVRVHGPIHVRGRVILGAGSRVAGGIRAESDIRVLPGCLVDGPVEAVGDVHLFDGVVVRGPVTAGGEIVVWGGAETGRLQPKGGVRSEPFPRSTPATIPKNG